MRNQVNVHSERPTANSSMGAYFKSDLKRSVPERPADGKSRDN
jgi:hypothetical protein